MLRSIDIRDGQEVHTLNIKFPDYCGICHTNIYLEFLAGAFGKGGHESLKMESVFQCIACRRLLIARYQRGNIKFPFKLQNVAPYHQKELIFNPEIEKISPRFVDFFKQVKKAEHEGINLFLGIGYRISLEVLVRDYLVYIEPKNKEKIFYRSLLRNIRSIDNQNIRDLSRKTGWIYREENDYTKGWDKKEIEEVKKLINLISAFIMADIKLRNQLDKLN